MQGEPILSVVRLDLTHPGAHAESRDIHRMHARVMTAVSGQGPRGGRVLWAQPRRDVLLVQAGRAAEVPGRYASACRSSPARLWWERGRRVRFSIVACPTMAPARERQGGVRVGPHRRIPLPEGERDGWLLRKLGGALSVSEISGEPLGSRVGRREGSLVTHVWHAWSGRASVDDPEALSALLLAGVGPAKGYGCGLLVVREAS
ncbi:type I-E CRISPR-associated protein Cas6/Cse3/CasE [Nonomuraea sp. CA-218870]|uniref:type I-E CRISPR-associated protein Cas6/Cse3/CasE n=1 Tax=Nonomuraea sp. CA-218870 TaxID=3239998 RepID=UPI003D927C71